MNDARRRQDSDVEHPSEESSSGVVRPSRRSVRVRIVLLAIAAAVIASGIVAWSQRDRIRAWLEFRELFESLGVNDQGLSEFRHKQTGVVLVWLPGGDVTIGSDESEASSWTHERPRHKLHLSPFLIAKHEISQGVWADVTADRPSAFKGGGPAFPVETVSWHDCEKFCQLTGFRIPTEAQWEYACRAGSNTPFAFGDGLHSSAENFNGTKPYEETPSSVFREQPVRVDSLRPNAFGLFHMHGNVREWCRDVYDESFYSMLKAKGRDPLCTAGSGNRVIRGGGWFDQAKNCRSATRNWNDPSHKARNLGFRPVWEFPE